ncbi:hypothetical protein GCM10023167_23970 [Brevibacterium pityocampae]|uniref:Uncharacterized protein n=1 Tax=Brevibacterium pityocampae TaxID=506594 RepID=A0ABP8JR32_9MICO
MGSASDGVSDGFVNVCCLGVAEGCSAGADGWPFCGVAVADDEGGVAEFGCGEDAAEGADSGAAEAVDVDRPG